MTYTANLTPIPKIISDFNASALYLDVLNKSRDKLTIPQQIHIIGEALIIHADATKDYAEKAVHLAKRFKLYADKSFKKDNWDAHERYMDLAIKAALLAQKKLAFDKELREKALAVFDYCA